MTAKVLYPAGYLVRVTSWENDGDNYNTKELSVKTREEAEALVKFCWLFTSRNNHKDRGIGNMYDPSESALEEIGVKFYEFHKQYPNFKGTFDESLTLDTEDEDEILDIVRDYYIYMAYDLGLSFGEFYTRVCDEVKVLYFAYDVLTTDVTEQFPK